MYIENDDGHGWMKAGLPKLGAPPFLFLSKCKGDRLKCKEWKMEDGLDVTREHELIGTRGTTFLSSISTNL